MRPRNERRHRVLELGVLLLIHELWSLGFNVIPPVTLATIIGQTLLYIGVIDVPWEKWDVCISANNILQNKNYRSLVLSTIEHADDMHLYYNMASYLVKGRTLENKYGSANFALLLVVLSMMTSGLYIALAVLGSHVFGDKSMLATCAIGFSGVIFALKLITTVEDPVGYSTVYGFRIPTRYVAWAELFAIHALVPNASFIGHFAGILAGLIYCKTFIGSIIDTMLYSITGTKVNHGPSRMRENYHYNGHHNNFRSLVHPRFNIDDYGY